MCCGTDENVSADDRKGMILQAQGKGTFKTAHNPSKMPLIAQERAWEYKIPLSLPSSKNAPELK